MYKYKHIRAHRVHGHKKAVAGQVCHLLTGSVAKWAMLGNAVQRKALPRVDRFIRLGARVLDLDTRRALGQLRLTVEQGRAIVATVRDHDGVVPRRVARIPRHSRPIWTSRRALGATRPRTSGMAPAVVP